MVSILLKGDQLTRQVAGCFSRVLVHELRRGRGLQASVQDADEPVGELAEGGVVLGAVGSLGVVERTGAG